MCCRASARVNQRQASTSQLGVGWPAAVTIKLISRVLLGGKYRLRLKVRFDTVRPNSSASSRETAASASSPLLMYPAGRM